MSHSIYQGDPFWLTARYSGRCLKCGGPIKPGDKTWFYPKRLHGTNKTYCESCGDPMAREFHAAAEDEDFMNRQFRGGY